MELQMTAAVITPLLWLDSESQLARSAYNADHGKYHEENPARASAQPMSARDPSGEEHARKIHDQL